MRVYGKLQVAIYSCYSLLLEDFRDIFMGTGQEKLTQLKKALYGFQGSKPEGTQAVMARELCPVF